MAQDIASLFEQEKKAKGNLISLVLPLYNEEKSLPFVLDELYDYLSKEQQHYKFEITFIDDRSKDGSFELVKEYSRKAPANIKVSIVRLAKNSGSHIAISAGINLSRGNYCIIMASDGQDPASVIGTLIQEWENGNELVLAARADNLDHSKLGNFFSYMAWVIMKWSTNITMPDKGCDLLGMDKKVVDAFNKMDERNTTFIFRILSLGFKQKEVQYVKRVRRAGKSTWTFWKKIGIMFDAISSFSSRPLRLITQLGLVIFFILMLRWAYVVVSIYVFKETPTMLTILLNTIFTSLAIQVLLIGFIGDYIWRILDETRKRPQYEISDIAGDIFEQK